MISLTTPAASLIPAAPAEPGTLYATIVCKPFDPTAPRPHAWPLVWVSSYQGESEWDFEGKRLRFRSSKCPWRWSFQAASERYWNFDSREQFEAQHNGNHGMVTCGAEPVDAAALQLFRDRVHAKAVTGFFCHHRARWVRCKPTSRQPSRRTWQQKQKREDRVVGAGNGSRPAVV